MCRTTRCQLAEYKHIVEIEFIDAIPKSASGKILRRTLRDMQRERCKSAATAATAQQ